MTKNLPLLSPTLPISQLLTPEIQSQMRTACSDLSSKLENEKLVVKDSIEIVQNLQRLQKNTSAVSRTLHYAAATGLMEGLQKNPPYSLVVSHELPFSIPSPDSISPEDFLALLLTEKLSGGKPKPKDHQAMGKSFIGGLRSSWVNIPDNLEEKLVKGLITYLEQSEEASLKSCAELGNKLGELLSERVQFLSHYPLNQNRLSHGKFWGQNPIPFVTLWGWFLGFLELFKRIRNPVVRDSKEQNIETYRENILHTAFAMGDIDCARRSARTFLPLRSTKNKISLSTVARPCIQLSPILLPSEKPKSTADSLTKLPE